MSTDERDERIVRHTQECRYFNGIQHDACKAGVNYQQLAGGIEVGMALRLPCIPHHQHAGGTTPCEVIPCAKRSLYTQEDAEEIEREAEKMIAEFISCIAESRCPHCKKQVTQRQVGHCVYGVECGHRMYQGTVNPKFAERPA